MKTSTIIICLGIVILIGYVSAQGFATNNISRAQAIHISSRLWAGMTEEDVVKIVEKQNGVKLGCSIGMNGGNSWTKFYRLSDGSWLHLEIQQKQGKTNGYLNAASIQSNGVKIVSITLTNAP